MRTDEAGPRRLRGKRSPSHDWVTVFRLQWCITMVLCASTRMILLSELKFHKVTVLAVLGTWISCWSKVAINIAACLQKGRITIHFRVRYLERLLDPKRRSHGRASAEEATSLRCHSRVGVLIQLWLLGLTLMSMKRMSSVAEGDRIRRIVSLIKVIDVRLLGLTFRLSFGRINCLSCI